ncbi:hypothetical protein KAH94_04030 [bacterium]|nr:hypothetical protein [bacterium]
MYSKKSFRCIVVVFFLSGLSLFCNYSKKVVAESDIEFYYQEWENLFSWEDCNDIVPLQGVELYYSAQDFSLTKTCIDGLRDLVLHNPDLLFEKNLKLIQSLSPETYDVLPFDLDVFLTLQQDCPVFSLAECNECLLNRTTDLGRRARNYFEKKIAQEVVQGYVNVGGGFAFQDLVILTNVLEKNPDAQIDFYFIDPMHEEYIDCLVQRGIMQIDLATTDFLQLFKKCCYGSKVLLDMRWSHESFKQMLRFLKNAYPRATVKLHLYSYVEDFLAECEEKKIQPPKIIISSDLGKCQEARRGLANLISYAMEKEKKTIAFFLDKDKKTGKAYIYVWSNN